MSSPKLEATIETTAPPAKVWQIVSDLPRMGEWSPQCRKSFFLGGEIGEGSLAININRKGFLVWPTRSRVVTFTPNEKVAFKVLDNNTVWSYTLEPTQTGTRIIERREAPKGTTKVSQFLVKTVLGGNDDFEKELIEGMNLTLERIKAEAEK
ncbi:SRPBCC family protein [Hoyosella rhizosphaerae]|uniref:Polyketide cyclase n=1 Tax=Hoyosella rhizosphaerae TaxID=1755582 RepID=A0A916XA13_9ACTN|nr:SRPBCC family protein [Hoyosella rhizosphaerae]MBN4926570.1 SRPBCC family protein [Hoyosella rhizosphaerae]GGC58208.1 polyketide cyclase [Hoyosella rhizosphaerae]